MNYKRINNITGWIVCIIACTVYIMTMEATGSFWDCGEFASSAYKLQVPHPPGAPLFVIIARLFMVPFDPKHAATGVNLMSALSSGFTILFLFWSITHFAKKIALKGGAELTGEKIFGIMAAGTVGALAYTFSDSFWYSAVESEVYAMSSFFTAIVFWAILKWENAVTEEQAAGIHGNFTSADRWLILIFYLMGLSIGVHLLNLLTIPAIVMIYYFKRYKVTTWGTIWAFVIGCAITGIVQKAVIQWTIKGAGNFDVLFVNDFGMPFFSGFAFFFILLGVLIFFGLRIAKKNNWNFLRLGLWTFTFMLLGYSTYFTTLIRSNADTAVDMYNVDNPVSLVGYLAREQYGESPILFGQDFTADVQDSEVEETYIKGKDKYEKNGRKVKYIYADEDQHFFPRMWDQSNDQGHADYYASFAGIGKDQKTGAWDRKPTMGENISFFMQYQVGWMYMRYFMWNFAGKQDDVQGVNMTNVRDGNWKSGISFWDNARLGNQTYLPDSLKKNKANNKLFALPLILGLLGAAFQYQKDNRDFLVTGLLFFFTGFAIVFYLNMPGNQPRERDYAFVGSFYAFAIWIGLGVLYVKDLLAKFMASKITNYAAALVCLLAVPVLMANQEWDDHDRSNKTLARDLAINYLESCDKNAIVISYGDNDTYPLWYAQEVEGIRRDVRVINSSLLGTDWYINQLRYKVNESDPIDAIWTADQIEGPKRDVIVNYPIPGVDPNQPMDLYTLMKDYAGSEDQTKMVQNRDGSYLSVYPTKKVFVPVDIDLVRKNGTVNSSDSVVPALQFDLTKTQIYKNDAAVLNIIAANKWKRPIYFTNDRVGLGFDNYLRRDGLTYRLVPVANGVVNKDWATDKMMNKFVFGNCNKPGVYYDEENRRHLNTIRLAFAEVASNLADAGRKEDAKKLLERCDKNLLEVNFPYGMASRYQQHNYIALQFLEAAYKAGDFALADKVSKSVKKDLEQQVNFFTNLSDDKQDAIRSDSDQAASFLRAMQQIEMQYKTPPPAQAADSGKIKK
ncbi:DUF2723 domain-containing protein [Ferruginibacter lapsinanis]|uniref:glycosyltransferase family 117 protein n=1 Tax=Ferruginibacter lapsinanis TaxID=563172 RepID=UPI001E47544D|nr:DUF2723 domain-containing protein [Ferruginibacter lapsinanis]UEG49873.1 DUF2723 domain-containing protein [Ferruginibacter lapsinanis]